MNIFVFLVLFILIAAVAMTVAVLLKTRQSNALQFNNDTDLAEWQCPECGFTVQLGDACVYCYAKKPDAA